MAFVKISDAFRKIRAYPHTLLFHRSIEKTNIEEDIKKWFDVFKIPMKRPIAEHLGYILAINLEFRNLLYYRIRNDTGGSSKLLKILAKLLYPPRESLRITVESIGPGLYIQHGICTQIGGRGIGKNCWITQGVTIGFSDIGKSPIIGDNVMIFAGAKVIGDVTIGNNSKVGANAVVVKNVPPNCTVVGVPAYIVRKDGKKTKEPLE